MQFSNFTRTEEGNKIFFKTETPLQGITEIKYYKDNSSGSFSKKEFRWSYNGDYWASWETLNQGNLTGIDLKGKSLLFLEIRYTSNGSGKVTSFTLNYKGSAQPTSRSSECPPDSNYVSIDKSVPVEVYNPKDKCDIRKDTLVDADTLCGKSCDYYLWRPNHKGEQPISAITNLQKVLNDLSYAIQNNSIQDADNVSGAGIGVYYGKQDKTIYFKNLIEGNKIFISEDGAGHITVDMDDASINELYQLVGRIDGVNIGGAPGEIFKEVNNGKFNFRTIAAGNANVVITTVGDQVRISLDASISGAPTWTDTVPVSADVGGIDPGDTLDGSTSIAILEKMLYEYFPPEVNLFIDPSEGPDLPGYYEKWDPTAITSEPSIYGNFNNDPFKKVRITAASITLNGSSMPSMPPISYPNVESSTFEWSDDNALISNWEDVLYKVSINHTVNAIPMSPKDVSTEIKFVLPYIFGVVDDTVNYKNIDSSILKGFHAAGQKIIVPEQSNEVNFDATSVFKAKFVYAYDASYGDLDSIFDVKNDFNVTTSFDTSIVNVNGLGSSPSPVPYKVYIKNHWINVDTFRLIFNI